MESGMVTFEVMDMTCGHCVRGITQAVLGADPGAQVQVDLAAHRVQIEPGAATADALRDAITVAGYTPVAVEGTPIAEVRTAPRTGCCCA